VPTPPEAPRRHRIELGVGVAAGVGYSLIAATTTPFTTSADIVTALPMVVMVALLLVRWPRRRSSSVPTQRSAESSHPYRSWLILVVAIAVWELFNYLVKGSRADHPTFSSMTTAVNRFYLLKALLFLAWLSLAAMIVRRSSKAAAATTATAAA